LSPCSCSTSYSSLLVFGSDSWKAVVSKLLLSDGYFRTLSVRNRTDLVNETAIYRERLAPTEKAPICTPLLQAPGIFGSSAKVVIARKFSFAI
jgi:hypothetical protein